MRYKKKCQKIFTKKKKKCENEKLDYPRFLVDFYYHGTINVPCIREPMSIATGSLSVIKTYAKRTDQISALLQRNFAIKDCLLYGPTLYSRALEIMFLILKLKLCL